MIKKTSISVSMGVGDKCPRIKIEPVTELVYAIRLTDTFYYLHLSEDDDIIVEEGIGEYIMLFSEQDAKENVRLLNNNEDGDIYEAIELEAAIDEEEGDVDDEIKSMLN